MAGKLYLLLPLQLDRWIAADSDTVNRSEESGTHYFVHLGAAAFVYMSSAVISEGTQNAPRCKKKKVLDLS